MLPGYVSWVDAVPLSHDTLYNMANVGFLMQYRSSFKGGGVKLFLLFIVIKLWSNFLNYRGESKRTWDVCKMIRNICKTRFLKWMFSRHYFQGNAVSGIMKIHAPLETIYTYVYVGRNIEKYRRFMRWKIRVILRGFLQICKIAVEKIVNEHSRVKIFLNIWEENEKINPD